MSLLHRPVHHLSKRKQIMGKLRIGEEYNNWRVLDNDRVDKKYFLCKCIHCGSEKLVAESQLYETRYKGRDSQCHKCTEIKVGTKFTLKSGYTVKVIKYERATSVHIKFPVDDIDCNGYEKVCSKNDLTVTGIVGYPYDRKSNGIGYHGSEKGAIPTNTHIKDVWQKMLKRCYNPSYKDKSYIGCTVHEDWHNYTNFYHWYNSQIDKGYFSKGFQLDKDILIFGNKIYSESTCCLVPEQVNSFLNNSSDTRGTGLPSGIHWKAKNKKFQVSVKNEFKEHSYLALVSTPEDGYVIYTKEKERIAKFLAERYRCHLRKDVYLALVNYKCPEWDFKNKCYKEIL